MELVECNVEMEMHSDEDNDTALRHGVESK